MVEKSWRLSTANILATSLMCAIFCDVRHLLQNEGVDDSLRRAFVVYLVSHDRPMFEVLAGTRRDISKEFDHGFEGMTTERVLLRASYLTPRRR